MNDKPGNGDTTSLAQKLCRSLEDEIATGALLPGTRLEEPDLARRFSVSRTPVREALQLLLAEGLVEKRPNRGVFVTLVQPDRLSAMFEAMAELEGTCGRLAAERMTSADRQRLDALHQDMGHLVRTGDVAAFHRQNLVFHEILYQAARSDVLRDMTCHMRRRLAPFRRVQENELHRLGMSYEEHGRIVEAVLRADGREAHRLLHHHIMAVHGTAQTFLLHLLSNPEG